MNNYKLLTAPVLVVLLTAANVANANVDSIRASSNRLSSNIGAGSSSDPSTSNAQLVSQSIKDSNSDLQSEILDTTNAINSNTRESDKNTNQLSNAGIRVSNLQTTRTNHHQRITDLENKPRPKPTWITIGTGSTTGTVHFPSNYLGQVRVNGRQLTTGQTSVSNTNTYRYSSSYCTTGQESVRCDGRVNSNSISGCSSSRRIFYLYKMAGGNSGYTCMSSSKLIHVEARLPATIQILVNK